MTGVLLVNIGTPLGCDTESVRKYLAEFLTDRDVIDAPDFIREWVFRRWVVPKRAPKSAAKYQKIWFKEGSPLRVYSERFAEAIGQDLGPEWRVKIGMRYGEPSLAKALSEFKSEGISRILLCPVYPQYAQATTGSSLNKIYEVFSQMSWRPKTLEFGDFYDSPEFIQSWVNVIESSQAPKLDHWVFSFHGLPESQVKKTKGCVLGPCCETAKLEGRRCYRAQSFGTAKNIAEALGLGKDQWSVSFQSRLGPVKWLGPYTEAHLRELITKGKKRVALVLPSFVVDGLETLEEINIEARKVFKDSGGEVFHFIPSLNAQDQWVKGFAKMLRHLAGGPEK